MYSPLVEVWPRNQNWQKELQYEAPVSYCDTHHPLAQPNKEGNKV